MTNQTRPCVLSKKPSNVTMDPIEDARFLKKHANLVHTLLKKLHFNVNELQHLLLIYHQLQKDGKAGGVTRQQLRDVLHCTFDMTDDTLTERIFAALDRITKMPTSVSHVPMETWLHMMSLFLRGTIDEKMEYCFAVYDPIGDGMVARDNVCQLLKNSLLGEEESDDAIKDLAEIIIKKMDVDHDGKISFNDYRQTVQQEPLLLEVFGTCLPSRACVNTFLATFTKNCGKF